MSNDSNNDVPVEDSTGSGRSRHDILKLMRENKPIITGKKKRPVKRPAKKPVKVNFEKIADNLSLIPGNTIYSFLKLFYEEKKATTSDCKVMVQRTKNFTDEQLNILKLLCKKPNFPKNNILDITKLMRLFGVNKILVLRAFVDLDDVQPSSLFQFFLTNLPRGDRKKMGKEAWKKEVQDKIMTADQVNVFYNVCNRIPDVTANLAITILPRIRNLKQQHAQMINEFVAEGSTFGNDPISIKNISAFLNMWSVIPDLKDKRRFTWLMKKLSRKLDKQQPDLQMAIRFLKEELEYERKGSYENVLLSIRSIF